MTLGFKVTLSLMLRLIAFRLVADTKVCPTHWFRLPLIQILNSYWNWNCNGVQNLLGGLVSIQLFNWIHKLNCKFKITFINRD